MFSGIAGLFGNHSTASHNTPSDVEQNTMTPSGELHNTAPRNTPDVEPRSVKLDNLSPLDEFFSKHAAKCDPARISRNKNVTQNLFIKHPELFHADCFGENPNLTDEYLESKINELNFTWLSAVGRADFLLKHLDRIDWNSAMSNESIPNDILLAHEDSGFSICDNSNFNEEYFASRIARKLPIDSNRLCANKSISPGWLEERGMLNWYWLGYNTGVNQQFFRDNYNNIKFITYAFNKNADFNLIDRYITQTLNAINQQTNQALDDQKHTEQPDNQQTNQALDDQKHTEQPDETLETQLRGVIEAACYNLAVPEWFLDKWHDLVDMEAVASNSSVSFKYLLDNIMRVPLKSMSYNANVPLSWHINHMDSIDWWALCKQLKHI